MSGALNSARISLSPLSFAEDVLWGGIVRGILQKGIENLVAAGFILHKGKLRRFH